MLTHTHARAEAHRVYDWGALLVLMTATEVSSSVSEEHLS